MSLHCAKLTRVLNTRIGILAIVAFFVLIIMQVLTSQRVLDEVDEHLQDQRREFLAKSGAHKVFLNDISEMEKWKNRTGLHVKDAKFFIDDKPFQILGGSLHYFRFPAEYWHSRLLAMKACGLNTVTTYVPWNAHEPEIGTFDFSYMLDISKFLQIAQKLELYVVIRLGPYICAEWEWGGLPSWLLRYDNIKVRSNDPIYMGHVRKYFNVLLPIIAPHQYTYGGSVIAIQVENEYATYRFDQQYVLELKKMIVDGGIKEFLFVCDDKRGTEKNLNYGGMMKSINFQHNANKSFQILRNTQPDMPLFVSEYWTGWFNVWGGKNQNMGVPWSHSLTTQKFESNTRDVLKIGKNLNFYVFAGGTNFGFWNGGVIEKDGTSPDTTSYDYSAPITEEGRLNAKYFAARKLFMELNPNAKFIEPPPEPQLLSYDSIAITFHMTLGDLMLEFRKWMIKIDFPVSMEKFPAIGERKQGQGYGYALYEMEVHNQEELKLEIKKNIRDRALLLVNDIYEETVLATTTTISLKTEPNSLNTIGFLVENQGRINWVNDDAIHIFENQRKGIIGNISLNGQAVQGWRIWPLPFDEPFLTKLSESVKTGTLEWHRNGQSKKISTPALLKATLVIDNAKPRDTFLELEKFEKGFVLVNGRNLGRYWNSAGPQRRLYVPGVWLKTGENEFLIFEEYNIGDLISFHTASGIRIDNLP